MTSRCFDVNAVTATGTFWMFCERFSAVTMTAAGSPAAASATVGAGGGAAIATPASAQAAPTADESSTARFVVMVLSPPRWPIPGQQA